jgi:hypothetical protein
VVVGGVAKQVPIGRHAASKQALKLLRSFALPNREESSPFHLFSRACKPFVRLRKSYLKAEKQGLG